jgi:hypothetical protein
VQRLDEALVFIMLYCALPRRAALGEMVNTCRRFGKRDRLVVGFVWQAGRFLWHG